MQADDRLSRQSFLNQGLALLAQKAMAPILASVEPVLVRPMLRPPGAQPEPVFLALCTRCDACTAACPHEAISVHYGSGPPLDGTPVLADLASHPCLLCEDMPCIAACPTQALVPVPSIAAVKIGTAAIDRLTCTAFRGSGCQTCYDVCPLPDTAIVINEGLPFIESAGCTGCGICAHACPEKPLAIQVL